MNSAAGLDAGRLVDQAVAATGLSDFGDPTFREGLEVVCTSLREEAKLSDTGAWLLETKLLGQLVDRLRVEAWFERVPEIAAEEVAAPLVIVGLPRTGTTQLQRLLAQDPRFYWMAWWESIYPVPFPDETLQAPQLRQTQARSDVATMVTAMPELMAIHPMDADAPDEEVMLMEHSFLSAFSAYADVRTYRDWLARQDQRPAYRYLRRMLQFLQWQKRQRGVVADRWVLKSPHHLLRMGVLLEEFPNARIIQTHRDPVQTIPSIASFVHVLRQVYADSPDPVAAGQEWSDSMRDALDHTMATRVGRDSQFLDIAFGDTVARPLDVVRRIYKFLSWTLPAEVEAQMERWLSRTSEEEGATHRYTAAQFGLSESGLAHDFHRYRDAHRDHGVRGSGVTSPNHTQV